MERKKKYTDRELMELAYELSLNSIGEHTDKPDPLVGAVLATREGVVLATAFRGELRIGEHCEFTLIERRLKDKNLKDCVLYVTLEPCIDKVRKYPKRGCATHIIKSRIGKVFVGMRDPDVDIENEGVKELLASKIEVDFFNLDIADKIRESLKGFIDFKEREKLIKQKEIIDKPITYLKQIVRNSKIEQFSNDAIQIFIKNANADFKYPSSEFTEWAIGFGLLSDNNNIVFATKLGLLLFGEKVDEIYPHTIFKIEIDYGTKNPEVVDFGGPISTQLSRVLLFIKNKALKLTIDRNSAKREDIYDFPFDVLREVVANAIIHRDYSIENSTNYIYISSEKIIIKSPGLPVEPLTINNLRTMDLPSISRNPKIMYVFNRMGMAEQRGIGLRSLKDLPAKGFLLPIFNLTGKILEITLIRDKSKLAEVIGFDNVNLSKEEKEGLVFIQNNGSISVSQYAEFFAYKNKTAQRRLAGLVEKGIVIKTGEKRGTKYSLAK